MPRSGAMVLGDIAGKLSMLRVDCTRCDRKGQYRVAKLLATYGPNKSMVELLSEISGDCPKRKAGHVYDPCGAGCPDMVTLATTPKE